MKTYKEMTASVLEKAKNSQTKRNRIIALAATFLVLCTAGLTALALGTGQAPATPEPRLVLMCSASEYSQQEEMIEGVVTPLEFLIRVRDIRGINRYRDIIDIIAEEAAFREEIVNEEVDESKPDSRYVRWQNEDAIISLLYKGFLFLAVEDYDQVQDMSVKTTDAGQATVERYLHNEQGDTRRGISINWVLSETTVDKIQNDPAMKLSTICDTITVTVNFKDGTTETVKIELTADDEGHIYATHKGTVVSK